MSNELILVNEEGESIDCSFLVDLGMVEQMGMTALTVKQIAALLSVTPEQVRLRRRHDPAFARALEVGKAKAIFNSAKLVLTSMQPIPANPSPNTPSPPSPAQVEAALHFLKVHSPSWSPRKE